MQGPALVGAACDRDAHLLGLRRDAGRPGVAVVVCIPALGLAAAAVTDARAATAAVAVHPSAPDAAAAIRDVAARAQPRLLQRRVPTERPDERQAADSNCRLALAAQPLAAAWAAQGPDGVAAQGVPDPSWDLPHEAEVSAARRDPVQARSDAVAQARQRLALAPGQRQAFLPEAPRHVPRPVVPPVPLVAPPPAFLPRPRARA